MIDDMKDRWLQAWHDRSWRHAFILALMAALPVVAMLPLFFQYLEQKPGMRIEDPLLKLIGPVDVSALTFTTLYALILAGILFLGRSPYRLLQLLHAYVVLLLLRMCTMHLLTLEPPETIIPLVDPITQVFYPEERPFLKDLFFSGHTATLVLFALAVQGPLRTLMAMGATLMAFLVLIQHVHYTVDVLVAPLFAVLAWILGGWSLNILGVRRV